MGADPTLSERASERLGPIMRRLDDELEVDLSPADHQAVSDAFARTAIAGVEVGVAHVAEIARERGVVLDVRFDMGDPDEEDDE
jgi:hypothetical protein